LFICVRINDQSGGKILIDVEVEQNPDGSKTPENIREVQRLVPRMIEGLGGWQQLLIALMVVAIVSVASNRALADAD